MRGPVAPREGKSKMTAAAPARKALFARRMRVRKRIFGTRQRPRLSLARSLKHLYAQLIDDVEGKTLVHASTLEKSLKLPTGGNQQAAKILGEHLARRAVALGIVRAVLDRGGRLYHGRIRAFAEAARASGLEF